MQSSAGQLKPAPFASLVMTSANKSGSSLNLKVKGCQPLPSTNSASQEVNFNTLPSQKGLQQSQNTMSGPSKHERETHYVGVGESVTGTHKFHNSIGTGSASTNEKKESASHNLFNFADSGYNSSNPQPMVLWGNASGGGGRPRPKQ